MYRAATSSRPILRAPDEAVGFIRPPEVDGSVEYGADVFADLLQADRAVCEEAADGDRSTAPE